MSKKETFWTLEFGFYPGILIGARTYRDNPFISIHVLYLPFVDIAFRYVKDIEGYNNCIEASDEAIEKSIK